MYRNLHLAVALLALSSLPLVAASASAKPRMSKRIDGAVKPHIQYLRVFTDGKKHIIVVPDYGGTPRKLRHKLAAFYGTRSRLFQQRLTGGSRMGRSRFSYTVYDPRARYGVNSYFQFRDGKAFFACGRRKTQLAEITGPTRTRLLKGARFHALYWRRIAHALLRDDDGTYYYVDRLWVPFRVRGDPHGADLRGFHVYVGKRAAMKRLRMKNIVNDPKGQIFITRRGKLKLIVGEKPAWIAGKKRTALTRISVRRSTAVIVMIYRQLRPYGNQRLHKPCDDW